MRRFTLLLYSLLLALVLVSCGGGGGGSSLPSFENVELQSNRAVTQVIDSRGGTIETSDVDGNLYTLTIPAGALSNETRITMVPIESFAGQPANSSMPAGVHLLPEGMQFALPATLTIQAASPLSGSVVPFSYDGDLQGRHMYPATEENTTIEFQISHFSGYAALMATEFGSLLSFFSPPGDRGDQALQEMVTAEETLTGTERAVAFKNALQGWLDDYIKPTAAQVQGMSTFDPDVWLLGPVEDFRAEMLAFEIGIKYATLSGGASEIGGVQAEFKTLVKDTAKHVISKANPGCSIAPSAAVGLIAPWILAWQHLAFVTGAEQLDSSLSRETVLEELCVQVAFDPEGGVEFPSGIQPGQNGTLRVRVGYTVNDGPVRFDVPMFVTMTGTSNVTPTGEHSITVPAGGTAQKTFQWEPATDEMRVDIEATFGYLTLRELTQSAFVVRGNDPGGGGDIPAGTWFKNNHTWTFTGSGAQQRPTRFIISDPIPNVGQLLGMYQIAKDVQGNDVVIPMYGVVITKRPDGDFEGENSGTMFQGATGTVTVRGRVLPSGALDIRWEASLNHGEHIVGDEEIPPQ